jgi:hypothetical protein
MMSLRATPWRTKIWRKTGHNQMARGCLMRESGPLESSLPTLVGVARTSSLKVGRESHLDPTQPRI